MEIENSVPIPGETQPAKQPRKKAAKVPTVSAGLIAALKFLAPAQKGKASPFCFVSGHWVAASNGVLTIGYPVEEDLSACPHTGQFIEALSKCDNELNITQLSADTLSVKSRAFKALIPCVPFSDLSISAPDANIAVIDDSVKAAINSVVTLVADNAEATFQQAVMLQANTAVGTNGAAILEYWHGIDLPPNMLMPRQAAVAIGKANLSLTGFGYSRVTATFYFANGAFIKTALFNEQYPQYECIFPPCSNPLPIPNGFFDAVKTIHKFSKDGRVYFNEGKVSSAQVETEASTYRLEDLSQGMAFDAKLLLAVQHAFVTAEFDIATNRAVFFGQNVRGVIMSIDLKPKAAVCQSSEDDDIPF